MRKKIPTVTPDRLPRLYKDRREEGETPLRQCQLVQLHLLHVVDELCRRHNITYFLGGGSVLGAMRHNGFIPWDDDLDIAVPLKDYRKLLKVLKEELPEDIVLQTPSNMPHTAVAFSKIRDIYSYYCECRPDLSTTDESGIYLDIFPYEDMPEIGKRLQWFFVKAIGSSWSREIWFRNQARHGNILGFCALLAALAEGMAHFCLRRCLGLLKLLFPMKSVYNMCECGLTYHYRYEDIYPLSMHVFEDGEFPIPRNADAYLTETYGDWRTPLPPDRRPRHARIIDAFHAAMPNECNEYPQHNKRCD